jgi:hypothetical protein
MAAHRCVSNVACTRQCSRTKNQPTDHGIIKEKRGQDRREEDAMCYNCGCGKPGDDMGDPKNITDKTFEEAAKASKQSPKEAKKKTLELLKIILEKE